ncbi:MAG: sigma-70 family RNA polymerase sigma factor [Pseudomonadota bacterium]
MLAYADSLVRNNAYIEDIVQEAWIRLDRTVQERPIREPMAYVFRIVRNLCVDHERRHARERRLIEYHRGHDIADGIDHWTPEAETVATDQMRRLADVIGELPERTQRALELRRSGCKLAEIASVLGVSTSVAYGIVTEGIAHCRRRLNDMD